MAHELKVLDGWLYEHSWPRMACPTCNEGRLVKESMQSFADAESSELQKNHPDWEPDWLSGSFSGVFKCDKNGCGETVIVAGDWEVTINEGDPSLGQYDEGYRLRFVQPAFRLLSLPAGTPNNVSEGIDSAAAVLWTSPSAAANRLRYAVEELLTAKRVNKTAPKRSGGRRRLSAHERIDLFRQTNPDVADALEAVKWIGNDGSHDEGLSVSDVLDGVEVLELAIRLLYDKTDDELRRRIRDINRNRGIRRGR